MRRFLIFLIILLPATALAHSPGQPPYVQINGQFSAIYPVGLSSTGLTLPQDLSPVQPVINQPVHFSLVQSSLPFTQENLDHTTFTWQLGDGTTVQGSDLTHTYTSSGPHLVTLTSVTNPDPTGSLGHVTLDVILLNILPRPGYTLPTPVIRINGKAVANPYTDVQKINFSSPVQLDGSKSRPGSSRITSYLWDLGDSNKGTGATLTHRYDALTSTAIPFLRVTDANGFYADTFVQLSNSNLAGGQPLASSAAPLAGPQGKSQLRYAGPGVVVLIALLYGLARYYRKK